MTIHIEGKRASGLACALFVALFASYDGALAAYELNGPLGRGILVSALFAMVATAALSVVLDLTLWRPLRRRRAGFMSLFLASIGLALVLRQSLLLAAGPQPRSFRVDP